MYRVDCKSAKSTLSVSEYWVLGAIYGLVPPVQGILWFCDGLDLELDEGCLDMYWHGDAHISVELVPLECEA